MEKGSLEHFVLAESCSLWLCDFVHDAALVALSLAIAHCSIALGIHMNLKIL